MSTADGIVFEAYLPHNKHLLSSTQYSRNERLCTAVKNNDLLIFGYFRSLNKASIIPIDIINFISTLHLYVYINIVVLDGGCSVKIMPNNSGYKLNATSSFPTVRSDIFVKKEIGRYYYEFIVDSIGFGTHLGQIGWMDDKSVPNNSKLTGVGDDIHSWAFDGGRIVTWPGRRQYGKRWKVGDVVGCCIDVMDPNNNEFELSYYINGEFLGIAFKECRYTGHLYPAFSTQIRRTEGTMVFDKELFQFIPDEYDSIF